VSVPVKFILDEQHNLHLLWIERSQLNGPSRPWYSRGKTSPGTHTLKIRPF